MNTDARVNAFRTLLVSGIAAACLFLAEIAGHAAEPIIITSASKQFVVRGAPQRSALARGANGDVVYIDPSILVVTCERVKQALTKVMGWGDRWHSPIVVSVHPIQFDNERPAIRRIRTPDGWLYRLDLPDELDRTRLLQSLVETLLLEYASRSARDQSVELPPWLTEGLTAHLMQTALAGIAMQPHAVNMRHRARNDPASVVRRNIEQTGTLSVDQLNWPDFDRNDERRIDAYHHSAHLFVRELMRLRGGSDCLCTMLAMLPDHLNWQTAFLRAFDSHFRRMLDVEKWWSLSMTQLKTHDTSLLWSASEAQQKLEEILYTAMLVQLTKSEMPHISPVSLQTVINDWDFVQQTALLQAKLTQLQLASVRLSGELRVLADAYKTTIEKYLRTRQNAWFDATGRAAAKEAIARLNILDEQRARQSNRIFTAAAASGPAGEVPLTPQ